MYRCLWVNLKLLRCFESMENKQPNNNSKPLKQNWLGESEQVQEAEPLTSYTQVLQEQETEPHYNALIQKLTGNK